MGKIKVILSNKDRLVTAMTKFAEGVSKRAQAALTIEGERIMTTAKKLTPVLTGALRSSGTVVTRTEGKLFVVDLGFGGPAAPYALFVHEDAFAYHKVGQSEFLRQPFLASKDRILKSLAKASKV